VITGGTRGKGLGRALARHLLHAGNEVRVLPARSLGGSSLHEQIREIVAQSAGGRTDRPIYHVFCSPEPSARDGAAARQAFWDLFEREFGLSGQPYCGVEHTKDGRKHEHRVYGLVLPSGKIVDLRFDYARREKCARIVEHAQGLPAVPSRHARTVSRRLHSEGRHDVAAWMEAAGTTTAPRPEAPLTPRERMVQERTDTLLDATRTATLEAWRASNDGSAFVVALRARGLDLRLGRRGPVIVDGSGAAHLTTRVIGAAARRFEGARIPAAEVQVRLAGLTLERIDDAGDGDRAAARRPGEVAPRAAGGPGAAGGGERVRRPGRDAGRPDGGGGGHGGRGEGPAMQRLCASAPGQRLAVRRRLMRSLPGPGYQAAAARAWDAIALIEAATSRKRDRAWALWGLTDMWGLPLC